MIEPNSTFFCYFALSSVSIHKRELVIRSSNTVPVLPLRAEMDGGSKLSFDGTMNKIEDVHVPLTCKIRY
jgi:hypothetical protein